MNTTDQITLTHKIVDKNNGDAHIEIHIQGNARWVVIQSTRFNRSDKEAFRRTIVMAMDAVSHYISTSLFPNDTIQGEWEFRDGIHQPSKSGGYYVTKGGEREDRYGNIVAPPQSMIDEEQPCKDATASASSAPES